MDGYQKGGRKFDFKKGGRKFDFKKGGRIFVQKVDEFKKVDENLTSKKVDGFSST